MKGSVEGAFFYFMSGLQMPDARVAWAYRMWVMQSGRGELFRPALVATTGCLTLFFS